MLPKLSETEKVGGRFSSETTSGASQNLSFSRRLTSLFTSTSLRKFSRLPFLEQIWLLRAGFYLLLVSRLHERFPVRRTQRLLSRLSRMSHCSTSSLTITRAVWAVLTVSPLLRGASNCFVRALVLQALLAEHGITTQLYVGFAPKGETVEGHAWLEHDNEVLIGDIEDLSRYRAHATVYSSQTT